MFKTFKWAAPLVAATSVLVSSAANAAIWSSSDKFGSYSSGSYSWNNDVWGSGAGPQTIWVNSTSSWGTWSQQPNTGGIKSYPHININANKNIDSMNTLTSSWNQTTPSFGSWDAAYDVWDSNHSHEIMIWTNWMGNINPISYNWNSSGQPVPRNSNVCVGGSCWNVYLGSNGANQVLSFLRTSKTNSGSVDIKALLKWAKSQGIFGNLYIGSVQYGVEITSTNNTGTNFGFTNYFTWN
ncbi:MAG: hypothetical protein ABIQ32_10030 [Sphingomicrobium sp.]